ncbi:MAG: hypothetical protein IIC18_07710, partial [Bacteroidetes bacterium]|nr:hypothetical protein [Bacteroidota bacterium]
RPYANVYPDVTILCPTELEPRDINTADRVIIPPDTARKETEILQDRFPALLAAVRKRGINRICDPAENGRVPVGLISSGVSALYLEHALELLGLRGAMPLLKLGMVYPLDPDIIREFAGQVDSIIVVEQKRDFIESHISKIIGDHYQNGRLDTLPPVWGKQLPGGLPGIPSEHGLNASVILERLVPVFLAMDPLPAGADRARMQEEYDLIRETAGYDVTIPSRSPSFCPGCPHRDSASVINEINTDFTDAAYMQRRIESAYVEWLEAVVAHFETWSVDVIGYEIPQVLLLHANQLNAAAFDDVASMLERRGYRFISLEEALEDPAYTQPDPYIGPYGISWLHRWARGKEMEVRWEPDVPDWINSYGN